MRGLAVALVGLCMVLAPASAVASNRLADVNAQSPTLKVNGAGYALVEYGLASGQQRHVLVWGAVDARAPDPNGRQVRFDFDYAGGYRAFRNGRYWQSFRDACRPYDGPQLAYFVAGCKAPDGTYWALQAWQRSLPLLGFAPWLPSQGAVELHVSHWSGPVAALEVYAHWTYGGEYVGLFGRLTYGGAGVYGFGAKSGGNPTDSFGRNVYIDTFDSAYGAGWARESGILLHVPTGTFCHSFVPQRPLAGYPSGSVRPAAPGQRFRVTVVGPGVTPDVEWEGQGLGPYDADADARLNAVFDRVMAGDARCAPER